MADEVPQGATNPAAEKRAAIMDTIDSARLAMLEEDGVDIAKLREDRAEEEKVAAAAAKAEDPAPEPDPDPAPEPDPEPDPKNSGGDPAPVKEPVAAAPDADPLAIVVIDGVQTQVRQSDLVRNYQIRGAADRRLQQANEILANAKRTAQGEPEPAPKAAPKDDEFGDFDFDAVAQKIRYGEDGEAGEALKETVRKLRETSRAKGGPQLTPEQMEARVMERLETREATRVFGEEFSDILSSPVTTRTVADLAFHMTKAAEEDARQTGNPMPSRLAIYRAAGTVVRDEIKSLAGRMGLQDSGGGSPKPKEDPEPEKPKVEVSAERDADKRRHNPPAPRVSAAPSARRGADQPVEQTIGQSRNSAVEQYQKQRAQQRTGQGA